MALLSVFYFLLHFQSMNGEERHDFHISVCDIKYVGAKQTLQITQRIFLDDLEEILILYANDPLIDVTHPENPKKLDSLVLQYTKEHLSFTVNQKKADVQFLGSESKDDLMLIYIEINAVENLESIQVSNDLLIERFPDQMNLVNVEKNGKVKSIRLTKGETADSISFD